jgi:hypothetical protein
MEKELDMSEISSDWQRLGTVYPKSVVTLGDTRYFLIRTHKGDKMLGVEGDDADFEGWREDRVRLCPLTAENAAVLRERLPWLRPQPLGLKTSAGSGDRLGLATPGHIRAFRAVGGISPILAQQSMRENARTGRSPQQVMDDAMWGVLQEGWREPWGSDADHLKSTDHVDLCVAAGYTFYTIDPGDHVDNAAHTDPLKVLRNKYEALPWDRLEDTQEDMRSRYLGQTHLIGGLSLAYEEASLLRATVKYGRAIAHTTKMYRHLKRAKGDAPFDLEVSVDETETPTTPLEHLFIASELKRLGVQWVSLAPRYVGRFEKGVDYIGDLEMFEASFTQHAAIARAVGPYKLSIHSGSDKFSIYPMMAEHTQGLSHLKTAGTSYLEALRAVAQVAPDLFREILTLAIARYPEDRATYHVSAEADKVPNPETLDDEVLESVLDRFDGREVLHVTFGSVLDAMEDRLKAVLDDREEAHYAALRSHFIKHLLPFQPST